MVRREDVDGCVLFSVTVLQAVSPNRFLGTNGQEYELCFMDAFDGYPTEDQEKATQLLHKMVAGKEFMVGARPVPAGTPGPTVVRVAWDMKTDEDLAERLPSVIQTLLQSG